MIRKTYAFNMKQSIVLVSISLLMLFNNVPAFPNEIGDIQVLIDVSGSMKQNDPKNLRIGATQLLVKLLPDGVNASLWLFSEQTELLSHTDAVNDQWRTLAQKASQTIHSRGLYTDIEKAIDTVLKSGFADSQNKNLILLTDGMVDISKDIMVSADSRERILSEWIPRLRQQQIKVQTIALSGQADKELLEKLAFDTDGWYETAQSAERLQRLFVKMALKAAPKNTVPLNGNRFSIDDHVQEFSVLVFKQPDTPPTQLLSPDQQKISKRTAPPNVAWLENPGYDLITLKQPTAGDWQIDASFDPDNQVMILTNLELKIDDLDHFIGEKDQLMLRLHFTEQDTLISRKDFLDLITLSLSIDDQEPQNIPPLTGNPGYFTKSLSNLSQGKHHLSMIADGKTFERAIARDVEVIASPILVEKLVDTPNRQVTLKFMPDLAVLDSTALSIIAVIQQDDKAAEEKAVLEQGGEWLLTLNRLPVKSLTRIHFNILAKTIAGETITPALAPMTIDDSLFPFPDIKIQAQAQPESDDVNKEQSPEPVTTPENPQQNQSTENEDNGVMIIGIVAIVNILLIGIGFLVFKILKSAKTKKQEQILERLA